VEALTSIKTAKFDAELEKNMTIRLGYANVKIWQCPDCPEPLCFTSSGSKVTNEDISCNNCMGPVSLVRHISFVDCPGHNVLMATMLNGVTVMDAALLLVAANEPCPQPQTKEHLLAVEHMGLRTFAVIQNKIDLLTPERARLHCQSVRAFLGKRYNRFIPIIPISAQRKLNLEYVMQYLAHLPLPPRHLHKPPLMRIIRSFDVNKPGTEIDDLTGGISGGSITQGLLKVGQTVEIRPGIAFMDKGVKKCQPIRTKVLSMTSEFQNLDLAGPGGLIAIQTTIDPSLTKADRLVGQILGIPGHLPDVYESIIISYCIMNRVVGINSTQNDCSASSSTNRLLVQEEILKVNIGSSETNATVKSVIENKAKLSLEFPSCCSMGEKISISRRIAGHWRLVGFGKIEKESYPINLSEK
jgi:translation initiation factor 2 subunit 3